VSAPKTVARLKARQREKAKVNVHRRRCTLTSTGFPENTPTIHKYNNRPKIKTRHASSLSLANSTAVTLRAALLGLASDAPGRHVMTGTAATYEKKRTALIFKFPSSYHL
jgi:hypothetical protein